MKYTRDEKQLISSFSKHLFCLYLADMYGRNLGRTHGGVARRVGQRFAGSDGELLFLLGGNDLLGN